MYFMLRSRKTGQYRNIGLLILRIGIGILFIIHGYPKVFGGPEVWTEHGQAMSTIGIDFAPMFFGFVAGITEFFGGIFLLFGLFFMPSVVMLFLVMLVVAAKQIAVGEGFATYSHSIEIAIVFLSLVFLGPGRYSLDKRLNRRARRRLY